MTGRRQNKSRARFRTLLIMFLSLLAVMAASFCVGALALAPDEIFEVLRSGEPRMHYLILCDIRLPRILLGALTGAGLAVSGALLQSVLRNPLAAPGIIGVSSGGGLAGIVLMLAFPAFSGLLVPAAFAGSLLTAAAVYMLAWKRGLSPVRLILSGVAVASMLGAIGAAVMLFNAEKAGGILDFSIGTLAAAGWGRVIRTWPYILAGLAAASALSSKLNTLALGDDIAAGLGMKVEKVRLAAIAAAALCAAAAVSAVGLLGFVGLIGPHIVRMLIGNDNRFPIPGSALFGAALVVGCDTVGRIAMAPAELPVGIIMAMLGPPFFIWLLRRHSHED